MYAIPLVNLDKATVANDDDELDLDGLRPIAEELVKAFTEMGFLYITNHGIPEEVIQGSLQQSQRYFTLPMDTKLQGFRDWRKERCGFIPTAETLQKLGNKSGKSGDEDEPAVERFNSTKPPDAKEIMDICHNCPPHKFPDASFPEFKPTMMQLMHYSQKLLQRMLLLLGIGLELQDPLVFHKGFNGICTPENDSQLRLLYYPPVDHIEPGQMRCGEHTDYGMLTFVFVDTGSGLQVKTREGHYVSADYLEGAILVNIGDLMQRWSGDVLRSAKHRVVFNEDATVHPRHSIVYFGHTDDDVMVSPVTGPADKYPPVRTVDHMHQRFKDTFKLGVAVDSQLDRDSDEGAMSDGGEN